MELLKQTLAKQGVSFSETDGTVQLILINGSHKWNVAFAEDEQSFLRYYARYPWEVDPAEYGRVLLELNSMNESLRAGCFMISGGYVVFRYGVYIFDAFTAEESIIDLLLTASARTDAEWNRVYRAVCSREVKHGD